jgi:protein tyrosine phosphatase (PTP) superfamily phosphohydrolase (DUF442 family)
MTIARRRPNMVAIGVVVGAALAVGGAIWAWDDLLKERIFPKRFGVVEEGQIYRSGQLHPALVEQTLHDRGIEVIVDLDPDDTPEARAEATAAERLGIEHRLFPLVGDGTGDIEQYAQAILRMKSAVDADQPVLVHCSAGTYRTGGVVAMYRVLLEGWTPERALDEMEEYDWKRKNPILPAYLNRNMTALAARLTELGVIDHVPDPLPVFPER